MNQRAHVSTCVDDTRASARREHNVPHQGPWGLGCCCFVPISRHNAGGMLTLTVSEITSARRGKGANFYSKGEQLLSYSFCWGSSFCFFISSGVFIRAQWQRSAIKRLDYKALRRGVLYSDCVVLSLGFLRLECVRVFVGVHTCVWERLSVRVCVDK